MLLGSRQSNQCFRSVFYLLCHEWSWTSGWEVSFLSSNQNCESRRFSHFAVSFRVRLAWVFNLPHLLIEFQDHQVHTRKRLSSSKRNALSSVFMRMTSKFWLSLQVLSSLYDFLLSVDTLGKPILIVTLRGREPELSSILLNSHYDVVPADEKMWNHPPFGGAQRSDIANFPFSSSLTPANIVDGKIFARGTQDMKCVCMQHLEAIGRIRNEVDQDESVRPLRTIHASFQPDEEIGILVMLFLFQLILRWQRWSFKLCRFWWIRPIKRWRRVWWGIRLSISSTFAYVRG